MPEPLIDLDDLQTWRHLVPAETEALPPGSWPNETVFTRPTRERTRVAKWPSSPHIKTAEPDHYFDIYEDDFHAATHRIITRQTPVGSMGSCFATRIAHQLQLWGYNYVIEEDDLPPDLPLERVADTTFRMAPARCGTLFDAPSMRQVVERAFGVWSPPRLVVRRGGRIVDPFRTINQSFASIAEYDADREAHTQALRRALLKCDVFILTLGLTEAWQFVPTGDYVSVPQLAAAPALFRRRRLSLEENLAELERLLAVYRAHKPDLQVIVSVSPVPLNKTFTTDHVVVANSLSKAVLRVVAEEFVARHPGVVHYLPSYEAVLYGTREPWEEDMRHVSVAAVARVMRLFQKMFLVDQEPLPVVGHRAAFAAPRFPLASRIARRARRLLSF
jgi:hypothetical protein